MKRIIDIKRVPMKITLKNEFVLGILFNIKNHHWCWMIDVAILKWVWCFQIFFKG